MPTKKKVTEQAFPPEEVEQIEDAQDKPTIQKVIERVDALISDQCGHVNKHHYNTKGKLEDLACTLPDGHAGDHSAEYVKLVGEPLTDEKGRVVKTEYHEEQGVTAWGDAAGVPASKIVAGEIESMTLLQKDLVMQVMAKAPNLTVEQATATAKASPEWSAAGRS